MERVNVFAKAEGHGTSGSTSIRDICSCSKIDAKRGDHFPQADFQD